MLGRTLLIIDDDADWRRITTRYFTQEKYYIRTAATCAEGIALAETLLPDYILLDYHLEDGNAVRVASHVRRSEKLKKAVIVVVSGDATRREAAHDECLADYFIVKDGLCEPIHQALRSVERRVGLELGIEEKGDLRLQAVDRHVFLDLRPLVQLCQIRFDLLLLLVKNSPAFVSEAAIIKHLYGHDPEPATKKVLSMVFARLRDDLGPIADRIQNHRTLGWVYIPPKPDKS
ncbi:MAG: response regulator [Elusimicrobia bacterium]|nr:response regulator [Elusimicrobiota bacterium]